MRKPSTIRAHSEFMRKMISRSVLIDTVMVTIFLVTFGQGATFTSLEIEPLQESGLGILCMRRLTLDFLYTQR